MPPQNPGNKRIKIILSIVGIVVLVGGLAVGLILVRQNQEFREKAAPATTFSIMPASQTKVPGQTINFTVSAETQTNKLTGVQIDLTFSPSALEITSVQPGSSIANFSEISNLKDNVAGKVSYSAFISPDNRANAPSGSLTVLSIAGKIKDGAPTGSYNLSFALTTKASGLTEGENIIVMMNPASFSVSGGATSTPTPTPTGSVTPTPTPTGSATAAPSQSPTATPKATTTATPTSFPVPESGISGPTLLGIGAGAVLIILSLILAF